jgi:hypothetical protein
VARTAASRTHRPAAAIAGAAASARGGGTAVAPAPAAAVGWSDDDPFSENDFDPTQVAPTWAKRAASPTEIPTGGGPPRKRPAAFYFVPGLLAVIAASLNIVVFLSVAGFIVIGLFMIAGKAAVIALPFLIRVGLWSFFNISANVHAIVGGLNVMRRTGRLTAGVTCGELLVAPVIIDFPFIWEAIWNEDEAEHPWIKPLIIGSIFALYNWPPAIWLIAILSGKQCKIDFDEFDDGELDELAEQLTKRAAGGQH